MSRIIRSLFGLAVVATPISAMAKPDCTAAKDMIGLIESFYAADPEVTNIIDPQVVMAMSAIEGFPAPDGIRYQYEGVTQDLLLDENGVVQDVQKALSFNEDGQLCKLVNGELVEDTGEDTASVSMNFTFHFRDTSGAHNIEVLKEGLKDGSKVMKSLAPGGLGFVVPKLKAFAVRPKEEGGAVPMVTFMSGEDPVTDVEIANVGSTQLFKMKALKKAKIESLQIEGDYTLMGQFNYDADDIAKAQANAAASKDNAK